MSVRLPVVLDGRRTQDRPLGGVGRSVAGMLPHLAEQCDLTLLTDARRPPPSVAGVRVVALPRPRGAPEAAWLHGPARQWARRRGHLFHGTFNALPFCLPAATPTVVSIYDLTFELHGEDFDTPRRRAMRQWFRLAARYAARRAGIVVTSSRFSAEQLQEHYGVPPERLVVIPCAVDELFRPGAGAAAPDLAARLGLTRPYVVAVGGAPRRGADVAVAAWQRLRHEGLDVDLVVSGRVDAALSPGLHRVAGLPDRDWAALLAEAKALCYPTRYEGFGLPGLEAAASGTPVVATPTSSVPEVLGDAAEWCEDGSVEAVALALRRVLTDSHRAAELRSLGLARAASWPSWREVATAHASAYADAC